MTDEERDVENDKKQERPSIIDWLGPGPAVTIILTVGSALVVGAVSLWSLVGAHAGSITLLTDHSRDHEERIRTQEQRPPRLNSALDELRKQCADLDQRLDDCKDRSTVIERDLMHVQKEQASERLCERLRACRAER